MLTVPQGRANQRVFFFSLLSSPARQLSHSHSQVIFQSKAFEMNSITIDDFKPPMPIPAITLTVIKSNDIIYVLINFFFFLIEIPEF